MINKDALLIILKGHRHLLKHIKFSAKFSEYLLAAIEETGRDIYHGFYGRKNCNVFEKMVVIFGLETL
jgi:hypothetical protein